MDDDNVDARGVNEELRLRPCHAIVAAGQVPQSRGRFHRHRAFPWACGLLLGVEEVEAASGADVVVEHHGAPSYLVRGSYTR